MGDSLRSTLLKKRLPPTGLPTSGAGGAGGAAPTAAAGGGESSDATDGTDVDPKDIALANSQRYGKLKLSTTAQMKHGGRKYFDSADQKTRGLPAAAANPQNSGPSSHATVSHVPIGAPPAAIARAKPAGSSSLATSSTAAASDDGSSAASPTPAMTNLTIGGGGSPTGTSRMLNNKLLSKVKNPHSAHASATAKVDDADAQPATSSNATSPPSGIIPPDSKDSTSSTGPGVAAPAPTGDAASATGSPTTSEASTSDGVGTIAKSPSGTAAAGTSPASAGTATGQVHIGASHKGTADILLVEDVRVSQRIAQVALNKARFKVDVASTAEQAVDMFKTSGPYKIVLMDIQLPKMNGMEATQIIRDFENATHATTAATATAAAATNGGAPALDTPTGRSLIFGLTGAVEEENLRQYRAVGMNGCIAKGKLLATAVKSALEKITEKPTEFVNLVSM